MPQILPVKFNPCLKKKSLLTDLFNLVSLQIRLAGHRFLPPSLISFLAALHPQRCCCQGWEDTETVLWKEGYYIAPPLRNIRQEVKGGETHRAVIISSPGTSTSIHSPHCVCTWALYTNCPRIYTVCWVNIDWGETYLLITAIQIKDLHGEGKEGWANACVWEMSWTSTADEDTVCETFVSRKATGWGTETQTHSLSLRRVSSSEESPGFLTRVNH